MIKILNSKYGFHWMHISLVPWQSWEIVTWISINQGPPILSFWLLSCAFIFHSTQPPEQSFQNIRALPFLKTLHWLFNVFRWKPKFLMWWPYNIWLMPTSPSVTISYHFPLFSTFQTGLSSHPSWLGSPFTVELLDPNRPFFYCNFLSFESLPLLLQSLLTVFSKPPWATCTSVTPPKFLPVQPRQ